MNNLILNNLLPNALQDMDTLSRTLQQTKDQLEACKEAQHRLEMDWSDKCSAQNLGTTSYSVWCPSVDFLQTQEV